MEKKSSLNDRMRIAAAICFVVFIAVMSIQNFAKVDQPIVKFVEGKTDFSGMTEEIKNGYLSDSLWQKAAFIDLHGLFARATGRRHLNYALLLNNGMLNFGYTVPLEPQDWYANKISRLSSALEARGISFLYAMASLKLDMNDQLIPAGFENHYNENATMFADALTQRGVRVLDLRPLLTGSVDLVNANYYRTDHHWTPDGALRTFEPLMLNLQSIDPSITLNYTDAKLWERHELKNWFLGSHGKRVGALFAGTDPLIWYTPRFDTNISCIIQHHSVIRKGDFSDSLLNLTYTERPDYYNHNPYCIYIGGEYPIVQIRNPDAPNKKKVLIIKDSFALVMQALLATEFTQVDTVDPRHYDETSVAEYCANEKPDIVVLLAMPHMVKRAEYINTGAEKLPDPEADNSFRTVLDNYDVTLEMKDSNYNFVRLPVTLEAGRTYRFTFDDIERLEGDCDGAILVAFQWDGNSIIHQHIYDIDYCHRFGGEAFTFTMPQEGDNWSLLLYAGINGETAGNSIRYKGVNVSVMDLP